MVTRCQKRMSGPLMDRIDLHIDVPRVEYEKLTANRRGETSAVIRQRVEAARQRQAAPFRIKICTVMPKWTLAKCVNFTPSTRPGDA